MALQTTVIGAYPKPKYLDIPDWFRQEEGACSYVPDSLDEYHHKIQLNGRYLHTKNYLLHLKQKSETLVVPLRKQSNCFI